MIHMRPYNAFETKNIKFLVDKQIEFATIQITETGLKKSILDATAPVRAYFKEKDLHNYDSQLQGPEHKRIIDTYIMTETVRVLTKTSLYRPVTRNGDPRLWVNKVRDVDFLKADAETKYEAGREFFRVSEILHTKNPIPSQFDILLDQGQITVDFLLCRDSGGDTYSFKIKGKARPLLFPQSETYNLRAI